jgi:hypothetical protein
MSNITWAEPPQLMRGCVIDAVIHEGDDQTISAALNKAWQRAAEVIEQLRYPELPTAIIVELWQDTGRIIFIIKQRRDMARIVLTCPEIERLYFSWNSEGLEFEREYERQHQRLVWLAQTNFPTAREAFGMLETTATIRDSDDETTSIRL